jgi:hypothetical protein
MALFLTDVIDEALVALSHTNYTDPHELWRQLRNEEGAEHKSFRLAALPEPAIPFPIPSGVNPEIILRGPNLCHTARLPAEIRHLGYLTETDKIGFLSCDKGYKLVDYDQQRIKGGKMELIQEGMQDDPRQQCSLSVQQDYKDYFYTHEEEGWKWMVVPNDAEMQVYVDSDFKFAGYVMICFRYCDWNNCDSLVENILAREYRQGKGEIHINGVPVVDFTDTTHNCYWPNHTDGFVWEPDENGRFNFTARAVAPNNYMRISSFIVW